MATMLMVHCQRLGSYMIRSQHNNLLMHSRLCLDICKGNCRSWRPRRESHVWTSPNQLLFVQRKYPYLQYNMRHFHTSTSRQAPPVLAWLVVKSLLKTAAIVTGRTLRNRWKALPKGERKTTWERLQHNRGKIVAGLAGLSCFGIAYYYYHIEYTPFTNRPRFILFNGSQFDKIVDEEFKVYCEQYKGNFLPVTHPIYDIIVGIGSKLVNGNLDVAQIRDKTWTVHVVDKNIKNAFVLPNGHIFVFTGILQVIENEDQLGCVLAHEMAHVVLSHSAEMLSFAEFIDFFVIVVLTALWAFLPNDGLAIIATWFKSKVVQLLIHMPYNRSIETEADEIGVILAARSCFDVRESKTFWELMEAQRVQEDEEETIEWLSTHPSHQSRVDHLDKYLPGVIHLRECCNCPPLPQRERTFSSAAETPAITAVSAA